MKLKGLITILLLVFAFWVPGASASMILVGHGAYGDFSGIFDYSYTDATHAKLKVELTNTSPAANGGYLTAFVFNNPGDKIHGVSLAATDPDFKLLGAPSFHNRIKASPYGYFDIGAAVGKDGFLGGGNPKPGMAVGATETFTFSFTGYGLDTLTELIFSNALSAKPQGGGAKAFEARFRGFNNCESDKVSGIFLSPPPPVPTPSTLLLLGSGLAGLAIMGRRRLHNASISKKKAGNWLILGKPQPRRRWGPN